MVNINFYRVLLYKIVHYFAKYLCILYIYFINAYRKMHLLMELDLVVFSVTIV